MFVLLAQTDACAMLLAQADACAKGRRGTSGCLRQGKRIKKKPLQNCRGFNIKNDF
jgi:hypothetical protein